MPRAPRIQYPGAVYHVMARGDRREDIVADDQDRQMFVDTLFEAVLRGGWSLYAWVLMDNHYHLALKTPHPNLVAGMSWFQNTFTRRINLKHRLWGHVFGGRYKSVLVESDDHFSGGCHRDYLSCLIDYIHLNPARAGLVDGTNVPIEKYPWSSVATGYAVDASRCPAGLDVETGLELFRFPNSNSGRKRFVNRLNERARAERLAASQEALGSPEMDLAANLNQTLQRGWCWGSESFRAQIKEAFADQFEGDSNRGTQRIRKEVLEPELILLRAAQHFGVGLDDLRAGERKDLMRPAIAWVLARRTTAKQAWIAEVMGLSSAANVSQQVRRFAKIERKRLPTKVRAWMENFEHS